MTPESVINFGQQALHIAMLVGAERQRAWLRKLGFFARSPIQLPESAAPLVHVGETVEFRVAALSETYKGKIVRFSDKVDRATRTMVTEVDVPNPTDHFRPGMYAYVTLPLHEKKNALAIPVQALSSGAKPSVLVVNPDGEVETVEPSIAWGARSIPKLGSFQTSQNPTRGSAF